MKRKNSDLNKSNYTDKRCPECFTVLKLEATTCIGCGRKVGQVNKFGIAKRPVAWKAYIAFAVSLAIMGWYVKKVFF